MSYNALMIMRSLTLLTLQFGKLSRGFTTSGKNYVSNDCVYVYEWPFSFRRFRHETRHHIARFINRKQQNDNTRVSIRFQSMAAEYARSRSFTRWTTDRVS